MDEQMKLLAASVQPLNGRIVVLRDVERERELVYVQEEHRERFNSGIIVAMAQDCKQPIKVGDRVSFQKWGGSDLELVTEDDKKHGFVSLHEDEISLKISANAFIREARKADV